MTEIQITKSNSKKELLTFINPNGDTYKGEIKDGKPHGKGTWIYTNVEKVEVTYEGDFKNGKYDGQGTYTLPDGEKYVGEWKDGLKHGLGILTYSNGEKLVGDFVSDRPYICSLLDKDEDPTISIERAVPAVRRALRNMSNGVHILVK